MEQLLSPRQAAAMIGRSESTVRRWCDREEVAYKQTPGGHRRLLRSSVLARAQQLGLRVAGVTDAPEHRATTDELSDQLVAHLVDGRLAEAQRLIVDLVSGSLPVADVCDAVIAPALARLGQLWAAGELAIYQEHAATQTVVASVLAATHNMPATGHDVAVCAALSGDPYLLGPLMTGLVLRSEGFEPLQLGTDTPAAQILKAAQAHDAKLVALSIGSVVDTAATVASVNMLSDALAKRGCKLVVGGRALTSDVRRRVHVDFFGDTVSHLAVYARRLNLKTRGTS